jgi:hypothetical protein
MRKVSEVDIEMASGGIDKVTVDLADLPDGKRLSELDVDDVNGTTTVRNVNTNGGKVRVETYGGETTIEACDAGDLNVKAVGTGSITVRNCNAGRFKVFNAGRDTTLTVEDCFYDGADLRSNGKAKIEPSLKARIVRTQGKKISFQGGGGDDEIFFEDNTIESVSAKLGDGNDLASFTGSVFDKLGVDGGPGDFDCFDDTNDNNLFGSFKEKGFEPCGNVNLAFESGAGTNPMDPETWPEGAVAWRTRNPEASHLDGPFALPGHGSALGLPERDPTMLAPPPAHWGIGPECAEGAVQLHHPHDAWEGHDDPADEGCGHGFLEWGFFLPG